tara:strand:- start:103 stop:468 length:366 start_codon:yes stop_codon:yes gene_type:complete
MVPVLLLLIGIGSSDICRDFSRAYDIGERIYAEHHHIGPLLGLEAHVCDGWLPIHEYPGKVAIRPLYNDAGLPLYDIFAKENRELVGFEFRTLHIISNNSLMDCGCDELPSYVIDGYSIAI